MNNKYCLIVSQYRYSYHTFIVKVPEDIAIFKSQLLAITEELEKYKRDNLDTREIHFGDLEYLLDDSKEIFYSYNVNDTGDIYIRNHSSINRLKDDAYYYMLNGYKASRGYQSKNTISEISKHHDYNEVRKIIERNFEIA